MASVHDYLRKGHLPHLWCGGCGHGIVMGSLIRAIDKVGLDRDKTVIVSGIGCSSRAPGYMDFDTLHTTHGRALAFATGIKVANPSLNVIVITGDGDASAIGGNHLIHAARRNIGVTTVCFNNSIYGMTSGQFSPMTPKGKFASTTPYGNIDQSFDLCELVKGAGATFVARSTTYHAPLTVNLIAKALQHKGFAFIDVLSQCPTYYGRRNKMGSAVDMMKWFRDHAVTVQKAASMSREELKDVITVGEIFTADEAEYTEQYAGIIERAEGRGTAS